MTLTPSELDHLDRTLPRGARNAPATKVCPKCGEEKANTEFTRNKSRQDGLHPYCKVCKRAEYKAYHAAHPEVAKARDERWREANRERSREKTRRYKAAHPEQVRSDRKKQIGTPQTHARKRLQYAVKAGHMERPGTCSDCGNPGEVHGHHADYSRPLDVEWLCSGCHGKRHRDER